MEAERPVQSSFPLFKREALSKLEKVGNLKKDKTSFQQILSGLIDKVNQLEKNADESIKELITGEIQNIHQVMIAMEEASLAFQLMMEIRNKLVEAYKEIMRMQI